MTFVPVALACRCVIAGIASYDYDPDREPHTLVECQNGHGWQSFVVEPAVEEPA